MSTLNVKKKCENVKKKKCENVKRKKYENVKKKKCAKNNNLLQCHRC